MSRGARQNPLERPAASVARDHALRLVRELDKAVARFHDTGAAQALHDTRVALRRLRSWLQAFDSLLHVKARQRRRLRRLARASNMARDAEIALNLLAELRPELAARARPQAFGMARSLMLLREQHHRRIRRKLPDTWRKLSAKLRDAFTGVDPGEDGPRFSQAFAGSMRKYTAGFEAALADAARNPDAPHIHRLRIAGKKARYLTEAILPWYPGARPIVRELVALHDAAGRIQDLQRFIELSEEAFLHQAATRYRRLLLRYIDTGIEDRRLPQPASSLSLPLLLICRSAAKKQARYIAALKKAYLARRYPACVSKMRRLAAKLDTRVANR